MTDDEPTPGSTVPFNTEAERDDLAERQRAGMDEANRFQGDRHNLSAPIMGLDAKTQEHWRQLFDHILDERALKNVPIYGLPVPFRKVSRFERCWRALCRFMARIFDEDRFP